MTEPGESREEALRRAASVASFVQGEVLEVPDVCVVVVDLAWPLDDSSAAMATSEGGDLAVVPAPSESVVLLTQTCDLQRTTPESRFCQVAPVTNGSPAFARQVHRGYWPGWVDLPWHWPTSVADLFQITTLERSVLVGVASRGRPGTPWQRAHVAERVGRHFSRAALPDAVSAALRPFVDRIKKKYDKALQRADAWRS